MDALLEAREVIISIIKRYEAIIVFITKFILGLIIYTNINGIGFASDAFNSIMSFPTSFIYIMFMSILFAVLPINVNYALIILNLAIQFSSRLEVAGMVFLVLFIIFLFYGHFGKKESSLILAILFGLHFNIPYIVPLFAGLYFGLTSIVPITLGMFIWSYFDMATALMADGSFQEGLPDLDDVLYVISTLYDSLSDMQVANQEWLATSLVFSVVLITVFLISKISVNYAKEIAIFFGVFVNIIAFIILSTFTDFSTSVLSLVFLSILSGIIMLIIRFFDIVLDYNRAEKVEFEDEDNYYYVKVIPKIKSVKPEK